MNKQNGIKTGIAVVLLVLVVLSATGHVDGMIDLFGLRGLRDSNEEYLDASFNKALNGFLVLSGIKAGLAVLEGSEVGIGFSLEIGDAVQSIYDYVDTAWKTVMAGSAILLLMKLALSTIQTVGHWFLFTALLFSLVLFLLNWIMPKKNRAHHLLREALLFSSVMCVALYLILPVSVGMASFLSKKITQPLISEAQEGFKTLEKEVAPETIHEKFFPAQAKKNDSIFSKLELQNLIVESKAVLIRIGRWLKKLTKDFAHWTIYLIAGYMFDCIVFPYAVLILAYALTKGLLIYVFGKTSSQTVKEDIESVMKKYFGKNADVEKAADKSGEKTQPAPEITGE